MWTSSRKETGNVLPCLATVTLKLGRGQCRCPDDAQLPHGGYHRVALIMLKQCRKSCNISVVVTLKFVPGPQQEAYA